MTLAELPSPGAALAAAGIDARKTFGQHFLLDMNLCRKIAGLAAPTADSLVIEVGPGPGGLTRALLESGAQVLAIEKDARFLPLLHAVAAAAEGRLRIVRADALLVDEVELGALNASVAANLPYNIATPLLVKWLTGEFRPSIMTLMFQKEVAERIVAAPGRRDYGRLAILSQVLCETRLLINLPARAFTPPPKVESAVVRLVRRADPPSEHRLANLRRVTRLAFGQRRKMLRSALASVGGESLCRQAGVDPTARAERLSVAAFLDLADALDRAGDVTGALPARVEENTRGAADPLEGPEVDDLKAARKSTAEGLAAPKDD